MKRVLQFIGRYGTLLALGLILVPHGLPAQYFGRNKVPYERFKFLVFRTDHWDVLHYREEAVAARDAARMLERWNARYTGLFDYQLSARKPVILYADQPDFQQTNVVSGALNEGTGGVTESMLDRMVLPLTGSYAESDHVIGHEAVHVFQYDVANHDGKAYQFERLPLWLVEGMAEYLSVGPNDAHTAMWLRDALERNDLPTIDQLTNSGRYFPYRYGEALWAYIGSVWGDAMVPRLFRASLEDGFDRASIRLLGLRSDSLSNHWHEAIRREYTPRLSGRTRPRETGRLYLASKRGSPEYYVGPAVSPDGKMVAWFHSGITGVELRLGDVATGADLGVLSSPGLSTRFDALSFLYSAGSWSPDGRRLAFVSYADGDNQIDIVDIDTRKVERHIKPEGVGAISTVAWSPDGDRLAFSGMSGGISDLYLFDLSSGRTERLTNDKYADLQPAWSPDGTHLAFVSDRGEGSGEDSGSDFGSLTYAPLRLALIDLTTRSIEPLRGFPGAKHLNPQFAPDGRSLLFISDRGGYSDVYRMDLASGDMFQVTHTSTGVSGIAATSPALSVAGRAGTTFFSLFEEGGVMLSWLPAGETRGAPVIPDEGYSTSAAILPRGEIVRGVAVANYLASPAGLPDDSAVTTAPYEGGLHLGYIGAPSLGVGVGGPFGTTIQGGVSAAFTDILGNHFLGLAAEASGTARDLGGQVLYINSTHRWTWGANLQRIPYLYSYGMLTSTGVDYVLAHLALTGGSLLTQYARNASQRFELSAGYQHYGYYFESTSFSSSGSSTTTELPSPSPLGLGVMSAAFVGDDAVMGFTSPIAGTRYRFEVSPTIGSLNYQSYLADVRHYKRMDKITLAVRGLHYGRFGRDGDSNRIGAIFLGDPTLVRGYSYDSFSVDDCTTGTGSLSGSTCPQFDRLLGSRILAGNLELRIPLVGPRGLGYIESGFPPLEITPFVDAGVAWTGTSQPVWSLARNSADRTPVMSSGVTSRLNLFGFAIVEVYYAWPFQRPGRGGVWGFNLQPGW